MDSNVAVVGSCNMDLVTYVDRAPRLGETVMGREFRTVPGGKGANQAVAAARAGAEVTMIGAVGEDEFGRRIREELRSFGVDDRGLRTVSGPSGTAHIVVDDAGGNAIVVVPSANGAVTGLEVAECDLLDRSRTVLLQLEIPLSGVAAAAAAARERQATVILTPAPAQTLDSTILSNVDILVPNEHEAEILSGHRDPHAALETLLRRVPHVVITRGDNGALYGDRHGKRLHCPAYAVPAIDTTAAGDTFVGVLAVALQEGRGMSAALQWASAAAALSVQRNGATSSMPERSEIKRFMSDRSNVRSH